MFGATRPYPTVGYPSNAPEKTDTDQLPPIFFVTKLGQAKDKNSIWLCSRSSLDITPGKKGVFWCGIMDGVLNCRK